MEEQDYFAKQDPDRMGILSAIHEIILKEDKTVKAEVGIMMGKEMILYKMSGFFKYGLSSVKGHMSFHLMPIYGSSELHQKYELLLNHAKFQKGCINFKKAEEMPINIVQDLIRDCAKVDLVALMQKFGRDLNLNK
jgi:hypothetical protein